MREFNKSVILVLILVAWLYGICYAEPDIQVNTCVAVVDKDFKRWSEGGFLVLNEKDILLALTGYTQWNSDSCPANIYGFWSHDGGISWTPQEKAVILQKASDLDMQNVMSVSLLKLQNGDVLMSFYAHAKAGHFSGTFIKRSKDNCQTWDRPKLIVPEMVAGPGRNFQLGNGRIIIPVYGEENKIGYSAVLYSDDNACTCKLSNHVTLQSTSTATGSPSCYEPTVIPLKNGTLLMFLRTTVGQIYKSYSTDNGQSWTEAQPAGIPSPSSMNTLTRLQNGDIMLIFNMVRDKKEIDGPWPRCRLCAMISKDEGNTWGNLRFLDGSDEFTEIIKITMASTAAIDTNYVIAAWSRSPMKSKDHYNNLYDYRIRKFNLDWLYAGDDSITYKAPQ